VSLAQDAAFAAPACPVCGGPSQWLDVVDFNKSCLEAPGPDARRLPFSGWPVYYARCPDVAEGGAGCGFTFAPSLMGWPDAVLRERVYNDGYAGVDPDAAARRPEANAQWLLQVLPEFAAASQRGGQGGGARHLDYGGGAGRLSAVLRQAGWASDSFDPFFVPSIPAQPLQPPYALITAFEVFEHATDPRELALALAKALAPGGLIIISTLLSDGFVRLGEPLRWWYAAPRNGHLGLHTAHSLRHLLRSVGLSVGHLQQNLIHVAWRPPSAAAPHSPPLNLPRWAAHLFPTATAAPAP
jgi:SAM-dependent methyltransferase